MSHSRTNPTEASDTSSRSNALRARLSLTRPQLASWLGVSRQYITKIENGMPPSKPVALLMLKLEQEAARHPDRNGQPREAKPRDNGFPLPQPALETLEHLHLPAEGAEPPVATNGSAAYAPRLNGASPSTNGYGTPAARAKGPGPSRSAPFFPTAPHHDAPRIPLVTLSQAADMPSPQTAAHFCHQNLNYIIPDKDAFAVQISGDAMHPRHTEGDIAVVSPSLTPRNGDLILARLRGERGGGVLLRILHYTDGGEFLVLTSTHTAYPAMTLPADDLQWLCPVVVTVRQLR